MLPSGILPLHSHWVGRWGTEVGHSFETLPLVEECPGMLSRRWGLCTGRAVLQAVMKRGGDWRQRNRNRNNREENLVIRQLFFFKLVLQKLVTQLWYLYCLRSNPAAAVFAWRNHNYSTGSSCRSLLQVKHKFAWFYLPYASVQAFKISVGLVSM